MRGGTAFDTDLIKFFLIARLGATERVVDETAHQIKAAQLRHDCNKKPVNPPAR